MLIALATAAAVLCSAQAPGARLSVSTYDLTAGLGMSAVMMSR